MRDDLGPYVLGVDLGGSKILTAVADAEGNMCSRDYRPTLADRGPDAVIQEIVASMGRALERAGMAVTDIAAVGLAAPGISNPDSGVVFTSPNLPGWRNVPLRDIVEREFGTRAFLINDANAAALGELYFGAARSARDFIYVTFSTGIGGGIVIDGELYTGAIGTAGELGHMTIDVNGPPCRCGNTGCWETLASGSAMAREARHRIEEGVQTSILDHAGGDVEKVTAEIIHAAAEQGDALARDLVAQTGRYMGVGLASLINIFNPELIVIGGGLHNIGDMLLEPAFRMAGERAFRESYRAVRFAPVELGGDSGVLGAVAFALRELERIP